MISLLGFILITYLFCWVEAQFEDYPDSKVLTDKDLT
jgi:hypothetical protein